MIRGKGMLSLSVRLASPSEVSKLSITYSMKLLAISSRVSGSVWWTRDSIRARDVAVSIGRVGLLAATIVLRLYGGV